MRNKFAAEILKILLRPVVGLCLKNNVKLQEIVELCKQVFLEMAKEELTHKGEVINSSRLSVMTGVHRKDVIRLKSPEKLTKETVDVISKVIGQWQHNRRFKSKSGKPKPLSLGGIECEFVELVRSVSQDLNPYTILFELERTKSVKKTRNKLYLSRPVYMLQDKRDSYRLLARDTLDLVGAVEENILDKRKIKNLHIRTEYDNVPKAMLNRIQEWLLKEGTEFHERAQRFLSRYDRDINPELKERGERVKVVLGAFSRVTSFNEGV